jgi:hypothetical protein
MKKKPPIPERDSGGAFKINNPDDGTPIREMFELGDELLIISEKCTYRIQIADQIDPERNNPSLPHNFQQELFDHGTKSELLCRTLLQARVMFRKEFQRIDVERAKQHSLEAVGNLISMDEISQRFAAAENVAIEKAQSGAVDASMTVPGIGNVRTECKSFSQKADHFAIELMNIVRLFYPDMMNRHWEDFKELVTAKYGEVDEFSRLLVQAAPFLKLIRDTRDCLEHGLEGVKVWDFVPQANGTIAPPSIEVGFRKSTLQRCSISAFMQEVTEALQGYFEMIVVHMCAKNARPFAGMALSVGEVSPEYQSAWRVRFGYGMYDQSGQFIPCG